MTKPKNTIDLQDGRRIFAFCAIWLPLMITGHVAALIIVASSTVPRVPKSAIRAYASCMSSAKTTRDKGRCKIPKATVSKGVSAKFLNVGPYPWIGAIVVFLSGLVVLLMQSKQDFEQLKEITLLGSTIVNKGGSLPGFAEKALSGVADRLVGATPQEVTSKMPTAGADDEKG